MTARSGMAGLLLTGGAGRRLGRSKAEVRFGGKTLGQRAAGVLQECCGLALEVGPGYTGLPAVREEPPGAGPVPALAAGAAGLKARGHSGSCLVLAVDMPLVSADLLCYLGAFGPSEASAVPVAGGLPQPLCARYSPVALERAGRLAGQGVRSMKELLGQIDVVWVPETDWSMVAPAEAFMDIDDEADLAVLRELDAEELMDNKLRAPAGRVEVLTVQGHEARKRTDTLAAEEPMEIRASGPGQEAVSVAVTMRTPGHDFELATGFLFTEGLLGAFDVASVKYCGMPKGKQNYNVVTVKTAREFDGSQPGRNFYATSSCGICGKASLDQVTAACSPIPDGPVFRRSLLVEMPGLLSGSQRIFERTGGLHAAGLFDTEGKLLLAREDIGRHNACDKLIGSALLARKLPLSGCALFVSGRLSFEIVQKAAAAGIPLVAAVSAPSTLAVEAARSLNMTLAGFVRGDRFNIYTHGGRVDLRA